MSRTKPEPALSTGDSPDSSYRERREARADLGQMRHDAVEVYELERHGADGADRLATPVPVQRVQGAWAVQVQRLAVKLRQVTDIQAGPGTEESEQRVTATACL